MSELEQLIDLHNGGNLLNVVYGLRYPPGELLGLARDAETLGEPGVADVLIAAAEAICATSGWAS